MSDPKLGDHVIFYRNAQHPPLAAIVCKVHPAPDPNRPAQLGEMKKSDGVLVNLFVFTEEGLGFNKIKVPVVVPTGRPEAGGFCEYPPEIVTVPAPASA